MPGSRSNCCAPDKAGSNVLATKITFRYIILEVPKCCVSDRSEPCSIYRSLAPRMRTAMTASAFLAVPDRYSDQLVSFPVHVDGSLHVMYMSLFRLMLVIIGLGLSKWQGFGHYPAATIGSHGGTRRVDADAGTAQLFVICKASLDFLGVTCL